MSSLEPARARIAVTGAGVLTPLADELPGLCAALNAGRSSVVADEEGSLRSLLRDFDARRYANVRGMRVYPRNTQLQVCAAALALADAGLSGDAIDPLALGFVTASTFAHLETLIEYDRSLVAVGMQRTNPTLMPLGLPSAPGALAALSFGAKAFAVTLSDGGGSALSALGLGARLLAQGRAQACVVTGAFSECAELTESAALAGLLARGAGFRVFDRDGAGTAFGELAAAIVLEREDHAGARGKRALGFVRGQGASFAAAPQATERALVRAARAALAAAELGPQQISLVSAGASGLAQRDAAEARALLALLGDGRRACVTAPKSSLGESLDASGLVQCALTLNALGSGLAAPIVGLREPAVPGLRYLARASELEPGAALLTAIAPSGACSALLLAVDHA